MTRYGSKRSGLLGLALLIAALLAHQSTAQSLLDPLRDRLINAVTSFVTRRLKGTVEVGALRGSLFSAPVRLSADINLAASVPQVVHSFQQGQFTPEVQNLLLRVSSLEGQLPAEGTSAESFDVQDMQLQASARWTAEGLQATLQRLHLRTSSFGLPRTDVVLAAQWTPPRLEVTRLHVQQPQSEIQGQGHLILLDRQLRFQFDVSRLQLETLPFTLPPELPPVVQLGTRHGILCPTLTLRAITSN